MIKAYLRSVRDDVVYLERLKTKKAQKLESASYGPVSGTEMTGKRHSQDSRVESSVLNAEELNEMIEELERTLKRPRDDIRRAIERMPSRVSREIIRCRYLQAMEWREIADLLCVSERHVIRLHAQALRDYEKEAEG